MKLSSKLCCGQDAEGVALLIGLIAVSSVVIIFYSEPYRLVLAMLR
ncbi:MAG: hypothetical protein ACTS73_06595 [Arsenophonus sp. NEOnobi-MAG3]